MLPKLKMKPHPEFNEKWYTVGVALGAGGMQYTDATKDVSEVVTHYKGFVNRYGEKNVFIFTFDFEPKMKLADIDNLLK